VEHKIETLVAAPAAVEEALASLIVDHQDPALQYRALLTYIKRVYHPFLLREPQVGGCGVSQGAQEPAGGSWGLGRVPTFMARMLTGSPPPALLLPPPPRQVSISAGGRVVAAWIYDDPRLANTTASRHQVGAFLVIPSLADLADSLPAVSNAMASLGADPAGGMLHVAVCGSEALKLSAGAEKLLAAGGLGAAEPDVKVFSSVELIGHDSASPAGLRSAGSPQATTQRVAAAVADAQVALRGLQLGCVSVLAPGVSTLPLRSGFVWDAAAGAFRYDPFLRQVRARV
jgi:hypothetical protein